jgi:uncharacterized protein
MNPICFYHKADLDGVCSAAIVKHFVPECELYGIDYVDEFPWDKIEGTTCQGDGETCDAQTPRECEGQKRIVYMVDFSLNNPTDMKRLHELAELVWIDHHKTAMEACTTPGICGIRVVGQAACELCWEWFTGSWPVKNLPEPVRLLGRYDVWDRNDSGWATRILPFQYGMRSEAGAYVPDSVLWQVFVLGGLPADGFPAQLREGEFVEKTTMRGGAILRFMEQQNAQVAKAGVFPYTLQAGGTEYHALCLNTPLFSSQGFDSVWCPDKYDLMLAFAMTAAGSWKVSLYSDKPAIDCGAIAKHFGGGGHKGAAGFVCTRLPWDTE